MVKWVFVKQKTAARDGEKERCSLHIAVVCLCSESLLKCGSYVGD